MRTTPRTLWRSGAAHGKPRRRLPRAFTLIELLVVVAIMLMLTGLVVGLYRSSMNNDRIRSSARQVQSTIAGARDRAIHARKPRGVRFLLDANDPTTVTSMVYIQSIPNQFYPDNSAGGHRIQLERLVAATEYAGLSGTAGTPVAGTATPLSSSITVIHEVLPVADQPGEWQNLYQLGLIHDGARVRIPAHTGYWYTLTNTSHLMTDSTRLFVTGAQPLLLSAGSHAATDVVIYDSQTSRLASIEIELGTQLVPDSQPMVLTSGIAIDLINSQLPASWTPATTASGSGSSSTTLVVPSGGSYSFRTGDTLVLNNGGTKQGAVISGINYSSDTITLQTAASWSNGSTVYALSPRMDVMFTPLGNVIGPVSAQGLIHLMLGEIRDLTNPATRDPAVSPGDKLAVTIFPQTGQVLTSPVDPTDADADSLADAPFSYARSGASAGK